MIIYSPKKASSRYFLFGLFLITVIHFIYFFQFTPVYGWWQVWAYLSNGNYHTAITQGFLFPPLFIKYYSIFGEYLKYPVVSIILGITRTMFIYSILYFYIKKITSAFVGAITSLVTVFCIIGTSIYLPDDYHTFVAVFEILTIIFLSEYLRNDRGQSKYFWNLLFTSFFCIATLLSKQNIGLFLTIGIFLGLVSHCFEKNIWIDLIIFTVSLVASFMLFAFVLDFNLDDIFRITFRNDGKGSSIVLLTNFLSSQGNFYPLLFGLFLAPLSAFFTKFVVGESGSHILNSLNNNQAIQRVLYLGCACLYLLFCLAIARNIKNLAIYTSTFTVGFLYTLYIFKSDKLYKYLLYPLLFLVLANTLTSDLSQDDMILVCIPSLIYVSILFENFSLKNKVSVIFIYFFIASLIAFISISSKVRYPWSWFGASQSAISYAKYTPPYPELIGLKVDLKTLKVLESIKSNVDQYSQSNSDVLFYPNIPFFYLLHSKIPPYNIPVYWFDTSSDENQVNLISNLEKGTRPNLIVSFEPPYFAYEAHSQMKKQEVRQFEFLDIMNRFVGDGTYDLIDCIVYDSSLPSDLTLQSFTQFHFTVINPKLIGMQMKDIEDILREKGVVYEGLVNLSSSKSQINQNDRISISVQRKNIPTLIKALGPMEKSEDKSYTLKIYKLSNGSINSGR